MALGFLAAAATVPKLVRAVKVGFEGDLTYLASDALLWSSLEVNLGLIAACVPTLRAPFERALQRCGWGNTNEIGQEGKSLGSSERVSGRNCSSERQISPENEDNFFVLLGEKHGMDISWLEIKSDETNRRKGR